MKTYYYIALTENEAKKIQAKLDSCDMLYCYQIRDSLAFREFYFTTNNQKSLEFGFGTKTEN